MEWKRVVYLVKYSRPLHFFNNFMAVVTSFCPTLCWLSKLEIVWSKPFWTVVTVTNLTVRDKSEVEALIFETCGGGWRSCYCCDLTLSLMAGAIQWPPLAKSAPVLQGRRFEWPQLMTIPIWVYIWRFFTLMDKKVSRKSFRAMLLRQGSLWKHIICIKRKIIHMKNTY